jgi:L-Ala-D/L-Glu epimerase
LAKLNACDYFNVKLGKSGGIYHALKIVEVAKAHNLKLQVGCFMESRLAITALVHFAYSSDLIVHYDLDTPLMLKEDPIVGGMQFLENGFVEIDEAVGIGATIDEKYLEKCERIVL